MDAVTRAQRYSEVNEQLPMTRAKPRKRPKLRHFVAYDLETTNIPSVEELAAESELVVEREHCKPLFATLYDADRQLAVPLDGDEDLARFCVEHMFASQYRDQCYVAHNGNRFDAQIIMRALRLHPEIAGYLEMYPAMSSQGLRLLRVQHRDDPKMLWWLYDSIAMTGIQKTLDQFTEVFAPEYRKLKGAVDFTKEGFDASNARHREYALRDAEGLFHAVTRADGIVREHFGVGLAGTIGRAAIEIFQHHIPKLSDNGDSVKIWKLSEERETILRNDVRRGGYVYAKRFHGEAFYADINQAYTGIGMRQTKLPCGSCSRTKCFIRGKCGFYLAHISHEQKQFPGFYCIDFHQDRRTGIMADGSGHQTWITSSEVLLLRGLGWKVSIQYGYVWSDTFDMTEYVNLLERVRTSEEYGGPKSAVGEMVKAIGNNSFGKTMETLPTMEYVYAAEKPNVGQRPCAPNDPDDPNCNLWVTPRIAGTGAQRYHRPQIGSFITAGVRAFLYQAIQTDPAAFIMADTDSLLTTRPLLLDYDDRRYGAWKKETHDGRWQREFYVIGKKVYFDVEKGKATCKGLSTKRLTLEDYKQWHETGEPPEQQLVCMIRQRDLDETRLYRLQRRKGTDPRKMRVPGFEELSLPRSASVPAPGAKAVNSARGVTDRGSTNAEAS